MELFGRFSRHDEIPMRYAEPEYTFLDRCARPDIEKVRRTLNQWFLDYPLDHRKEFHRRFTSKTDHSFRSAFFELFLYQLLRRMHCAVEVHPQVKTDRSQTPDFLVNDPSGHDFYLEARVVSDESKAAAASKARINQLYDLLNQMDSPNFFLWITTFGDCKDQSSARRITQFLRDKLSAVDPDEIAKLYEVGELDAIPTWTYEHQDLTIEFRPLPKKKEARGKLGIRPLGAVGEGEFQQVTAIESIRNGVRKKKAGRYGDLDLPYVIALNAISDDAQHRPDSVLQALFGTEKVGAKVDPKTGEVRTELFPARDGVFFGKKGPQNTRVSAILVSNPLFPSNIAGAPLTLYHNPWATRPYRGALSCLPQCVVKEK